MKLNPCRFCFGNRARVIGTEHGFTVCCPDCNTVIGKAAGRMYFDSFNEAVEKWNEWSIENTRWKTEG